jgi:hypothetical protein
MSEEFSHFRKPNINELMFNKLNIPNQNNTSNEGVDLSKLGIDFNKLKKELTEDELNKMTIKDSEEDLKELEEFCRKHGIILGSFKGLSAKGILQKFKNIYGENNNEQ